MNEKGSNSLPVLEVFTVFLFSFFFLKKIFGGIWQGQQELTVDIVTEFSALFRQIYLFIGKTFSHFSAGKKKLIYLN